MTVRIAICVLVITASATWAQDSPMSTIDNMRRQVKNVTNATQTKNDNAMKEAGLNGPTSRAASKPAKVAPKPTTKASRKVGASAKGAHAGSKDSNPAQKATTEEASTEASVMHSLRGRRDPFQTVIRSQGVEEGCANGKKCLMVDKMDLKGIVRSQNGMIAVVENQQKKTYFLHENDPIFKGYVVKINPDSVVFQQTVVDKVGRQSTKEVVKRLFRSAA
jgi:hypothetical protein